jgi:hypothetical protein
MNREHTEQEVVRLADPWATAELRGDTTFLMAADVRPGQEGGLTACF